MSEKNSNSVKLPGWVEQVAGAYGDGVAHAFILSGNVNDYVVPGVRLKSFLTRWLVEKEVVAFFNRAQGITFPSRSMETKFRELTGYAAESEESPAVENPALAALLASRSNAADIPDERPLPTEAAEALPLIERAMRAADPRTMAVIVEFAESVLPDAPVSQLSPEDRTNIVTVSRWGSDQGLENQGQYIFLISPDAGQLAQAVKVASNKFETVEIPFPAQAERLAYIEWMQGGDDAIEMGMTAQVLANMTAGLNLMGIEDIFLRAAAAGRLTAEMVKARKAQIIRSEYGEVLEVMDPKGGFELIGGLDYIKAYFQTNVIRPMLTGRTYRVPKGVLLLGPAGTGKTITALSVAAECGMNAVKLNIGGQIASKWQGEGERKLRKALDGILTFAPTIVFIDEIDQTVSRGGGSGNQQESRMFQMLLEFMARDDIRGQVVFMGASNRPDLMDAALRRTGRFDDVLAFLVPDTGERENIFQVMAKYDFGLGEIEVPAEAVALTEGYTGAEIGGIVRKAAILAEDEGLSIPAALVQACQRIKASTRDIQFMTDLALAEIRDMDLVPPRYQGKIGPAAEAEAQKAREALAEVDAPRRRSRRD